MTLTYRNGISIAEIIAYVPCLIIAIFLLIRHGFNKSAGWYFLVIFSLARIIGGAMQLATIQNPRSISLYTGAAILTNVGFSPLLLATLGLLSRLMTNINKSTTTIITSRHIKLVEMVMLVGLICGIIGGVNAGEAASQPPYTFQPQTLSKVSTILFIVCWVATLFAAIFTSFKISSAEAGERRLLLAISISLPLLLIRLVYSCFSTFTHNHNFNLITGNPTYLLCIALIEEFIVTITYESVGLTLKRVPEIQQHGHRQVGSKDSSEITDQETPSPKKENTILRIAKGTIIGRLVMLVVHAFQPKKQRDVEMQGSAEFRRH